MPIKPVYGPADVASSDYERDVADPGEYPYTRGPYPTMYRQKLWTMRTYTGFGTVVETNRWNRQLFEREGVHGLSTALDLPTQMGYDSDHPEWRAEVGRVGVAIDSLADFEQLFEGIPLDKISCSFTINAPAFLFLALYQATGEAQGIAPAALRPIVQNDILKEFFARGACVFPVEQSLRLVADTFEYCADGDAAREPDLGVRVPHPGVRGDGRAGDGRSPSGTPSSTSGGRSIAACRSTRSRRGSPGTSARS